MSGPRVLLVEDYADTREMYAEYLRLSGFRVIQATDGAQAVERAIRQQPDLVLMDLALPRVDGWEATRRLKADPRTRHIPVVALTGHALAGQAEGAEAAGCDAFIAKPCLPDEVVAAIRRALGLDAVRRARPPAKHAKRASGVTRRARVPRAGASSRTRRDRRR